MRGVVVIVGVLGGVMLSAFGQGDAWVGELWLELAKPALPEPSARSDLHVLTRIRRNLAPIVVMRRTADGSVRSRYVLHIRRAREVDWSRGLQLEEEEVEAFLEALVPAARDKKEPVDGEGVGRSGKWGEKERLLEARRALGVNWESGKWVAFVIRVTRKRAKAFIGADFQLQREAIRKLEGPVVDRCLVSMDLGSVDLPELGGEQSVWWREWKSIGLRTPRSRLLVQAREGGIPGQEPAMITQELFEALGQVPDHLARGKSVRWESGGEMLRAFVENRAIYYRPDTRKAEDVRISLETAQEAWKVLEKRDRLVAWFAKEIEPGLMALMKKGRD